MPITANALYRDSFNFLRNQLASILMLALLTAFISVLLNQAFSLMPNSWRRSLPPPAISPRLPAWAFRK